jgi:hypothetical protein
MSGICWATAENAVVTSRLISNTQLTRLDYREWRSIGMKLKMGSFIGMIRKRKWRSTVDLEIVYLIPCLEPKQLPPNWKSEFSFCGGDHGLLHLPHTPTNVQRLLCVPVLRWQAISIRGEFWATPLSLIPYSASG